MSIKSRNKQAKERIKQWKKANPDYMPKYLHSYYRTNKQKILQRCKEYEKTAKGKACKAISRNKRRARMSEALRVPYSASELTVHFQAFGNECIYCSTKENLTVDHVIAIAKGGCDALSNILPCCLSCNCSKQDKDYLEWYLQSPHFNLERLTKITRFLNDRSNDYEP
ncbi:HNH endonuclease [Nostoc sp. C052]|uniref:HNH endonuclease n=1 Tax=Nostoc sp. C052 TaxID=2576902 RepID=UPI0015C3E98D|nr:HNH endonuclease [Nostoc sp. C052]QLE42290.1 HNH endonuclease [Nostoc sp. C052]